MSASGDKGGGVTRTPLGELDDLLGELREESPQFLAFLSQRIAAQAPVVRRQPLQPKRRIPLTFRLAGQAGARQQVSARVDFLFRGVELFATDSSSRPGRATRIVRLSAGADDFLEAYTQHGIPTWMFSEHIPFEERKVYEDASQLINTLEETPMVCAMDLKLRMSNAARAMHWPTCQPGSELAFMVQFDETCTWEGVLWGDAVY